FVTDQVSDRCRPDDGYRVAALQGSLTVPAGGEAVLHVVLGQEADEHGVRERLAALRRTDDAAAALERTRAWWRETLGKLRVETDSPAFDRLVNRWLPYQVLTARLWGRLGPHQRSGAYGFRDQLQDVLPLIVLAPGAARAQILKHCRRQFLEGDVFQWWHDTWDGRTGLGMRNRASDPHLWLPYVTALYVAGSGDTAILDEAVPFLEGRDIPPGDEGLAFVPRVSRDVAPVYEHCLRAINLTLGRLGPGGLPRMGSGDWNDGLSAVGPHGRGTSTWLGFFLHDVLRRFIPIVRAREGELRAGRYETQAQRLRTALDVMWREDRYLRAVTDQGRALDFADALCSSWPVLSGAAGPERGERALTAGLSRLERDNMVLLLAPPFDDDSDPWPGRIALYPRGVRENGGQYSHGASWLVDALAELARAAGEAGDEAGAERWRERALEVWLKISPLAHATAEEMPRYGLPPHQQPADIYAGPGREGRGGWSWYTGAAARMLWAAYALLGLRPAGGGLELVPGFTRRCGVLNLRRVRFAGRDVLPPPEGEADPQVDW
ncbi:MAG: hypothetical protein AB7D57_02570, partial [Desulfovibrionaceae bacterium]